MLARRLSLPLALVALTLPAVALAPATASAAKPVKVKVTPASPLSTASKVVLSFKADRTLKRNQRYVGSLYVDAPAPMRRCAADTLLARSRTAVRKGAAVKLTYHPTDRWSTGRWCPGEVRLIIEVQTTDKVGTETFKRVPSSVQATIRQDPAVPAPVIVYTPARLTLLDGSAMTIRAPGHADRSTALTGTLAAHKPGRLILNRDYDFTVVSGVISAAAPPADPLCEPDPDAWPGSFAPQPDISTALLRVDGTASYSYVLPVDAARLTGCRGHGSGPTTTVDFTGKLDSRKLSRLPLTATVSGITLADGTAATVTFSVFVKVDILDENEVP